MQKPELYQFPSDGSGCRPIKNQSVEVKGVQICFWLQCRWVLVSIETAEIRTSFCWKLSPACFKLSSAFPFSRWRFSKNHGKYPPLEFLWKGDVGRYDPIVESAFNLPLMQCSARDTQLYFGLGGRGTGPADVISPQKMKTQ